MTTIDRRILIPASSDRVWEYLSTLDNNPAWQVDCRSISFLTSTRGKSGIRWRSVSGPGHETVLEITAWYERLGYEYTYIDGAPFRTSRGRFRLQELPEGTIVQWTLTYELGGVLGGVRDALNIRRKIDAMMTESLRGLWREIKQLGVQEPGVDSKSFMRDAPDVEARSQYKPRHPSIMGQMEQQEVPPPAPPRIVEPPISDEDTRPRPSVAAAKAESQPEPKAAPKPMDEPDFLVDVTNFETPVEIIPPKISPVSDDMYRRPTRPETLPETPVPKVDKPATEQKPADITQEMVESPSATNQKPSPPLEGLQEPVPRTDTSNLDTSQISVFDLFGLPKPSETQELEAVAGKPVETETLPTASTASSRKETKAKDTSLTDTQQIIRSFVQSQRVGLRVVLRHNLTRLRHP
jgi:uncharacterized membrane protein